MGGNGADTRKLSYPAKAKAWIQAARRAGLKIDLILAYGNPAYTDRYDTAAYAKAAGWLARELANGVQAIEILNEPNNFGFRDTYGGQWNGNERNGSVSPYLQKYVQLLNAAAKEIKLANPNMTVIGLGTPAMFRLTDASSSHSERQRRNSMTRIPTPARKRRRNANHSNLLRRGFSVIAADFTYLFFLVDCLCNEALALEGFSLRVLCEKC